MESLWIETKCLKEVYVNIVTFVKTAVCLSPQEMETVFLRFRHSTVTGVDLSENMKLNTISFTHLKRFSSHKLQDNII